MEQGGGGRPEDAEHHGREGYGQATVEEAHTPSNPIIGNKWMLNDDDDDYNYNYFTRNCITITNTRTLSVMVNANLWHRQHCMWRRGKELIGFYNIYVYLSTFSPESSTTTLCHALGTSLLCTFHISVHLLL